MNPLLVTSLVFFAVFTFFLFKISSVEREREREALERGDEATSASRIPAKVLIQSFLLMMILLSAYTAARISLDEKDHCEWLEVNETVSGNTTTMEHDYVCEPNDNPIYQNFLKAVVYTMIAVGLYVLFHILASMYQLAMKWVRGLMERK